MTATVQTADALAYLLSLTVNDEIHLEDPHADGTGLIYRLRLYEEIEPPESGPLGMIKTYAGSRRIDAEVEIPESLVLEAAPMTDIT